jgi:cell wall-associated NlpC family hydrolase
MIRTRITLLLCSMLLIFNACNTFKPTTTTRSTPKRSKNADIQLREDIVGYAKNYVGSPYKYAGGSPKTGFDCSGFTSFVLKEYGIQLSPASAEQAKQGKLVDLDHVKPGDLLFFKDGTRIQHVALIVEHSKDGIICVHSTSSRGVIVENVSTSTYWKPKIYYAKDIISK